MIIFIISIIVAIICYIVAKKRGTLKNNYEIIRHMLWVEACVFMGGYFCTDEYIYKIIWNILMVGAAIFSFAYSVYLKRRK